MDSLLASVPDRISTANAALQLAITNITANNALSSEYCAFLVITKAHLIALGDASFIQDNFPGLLFAAMAEFDIASNQTVFQTQLTQFFSTAAGADPNFGSQSYVIKKSVLVILTHVFAALVGSFSSSSSA